MNEEARIAHERKERRDFLRILGGAVALGGAALGLNTLIGEAVAAAGSSPPPPAIPGYDWSKHRWAFGVAVERCIGCLRCVEACKIENDVVLDPNHFRTWVERYAYLEGEREPRIDSQSDPRDIAAAGFGGEYRFDDRYRDAKVDQAFFVPKLCNQCENPPCVEVCPTGATFKAKDGVVLIDQSYCIGCQYCVQACPYGVRYLDPRKGVADKCTWCYHRITKGLMPACVEICPTHCRVFGDVNDPEAEVTRFIRDNRVEVLKPETGNGPQVFYTGITKDVS
ncbi:MAG: 4Fe-4S dicluster domain-containing protein [Sphingomonadaceae bacterium]